MRKQVAWSRPFDVATIKRAAHSRSAKLNDIVVATVAGAVKAYLESRGSDQDNLRALVPVYVPKHAQGAEMGNHFGLVFLPCLSRAVTSRRGSSMRSGRWTTSRPRRTRSSR